jgi:regulatory protein
MADQDQPGPAEIRAFAQRLLAVREYAVEELRSRLLRKWPGREQVVERVNAVVAALHTEGLLSDERFAEVFIRSRCQRYQGPAKIRAELRQHQVADAVIAAQLEALEDHWVALAAEWLARQVRGAPDLAARARYYRRLTSRGFSHQQAMAALDSLSER